jgi:MinD superfamily P-loop ATPase
MSLKIAVASGKGGTGKTTVSVNLAIHLSRIAEQPVRLIDCDVEEPNDALFFQNKQLIATQTINQNIPKIDTTKCIFCRDCVDYCNYNAIVVIPSVKFAETDSTLCHSCGACLVACKHQAMHEEPEPIGKTTTYNINNNLTLFEGELRIGSPMQTMLIKALKKDARHDDSILVFDAPPGTSCSVVETISDADFTILVTEPTPFGLHDLKLTVELLRDMNKSFGVVVNKAGMGNHDVYDYMKNENILHIGDIPFSKELASNYASGNLLNKADENMTKLFSKLLTHLKETIAS